MEKYIVYGLGNDFQANLPYMFNIIKSTIAFCDNDKGKQTACFYDKPIISVEQLKNYNFDKIIITTSYYFEEIKQELIRRYRVAEEKILFMNECIKEDDKDIVKAINEYDLGVLNKQIEDAGQLSNEALSTCKVLANRYLALSFMPKNAIIAEIGVAYGDFSEKILRQMEPKKFFAIDYFSKNNPYRGFWGLDYFKRDNMPHQEWYEHRFRNEITDGQVETRQGFSWDCLAEFSDDFFDYVYLDAAHDYQSVCRDIDILKHKVKHGGYIQFNDYTLTEVSSKRFYGVIPAVNKFLNSGRHKVEFLCLEPNGFNDLVVKIIKS